MNRPVRPIIHLLLTCAALFAFADAPNDGDTPTAIARTNAENYKDMLLARCIATAYKADKTASKDASTTASIYIEWTYFDLEKADTAPTMLIEKFLRRNYHNPFEGYADSRFDLLKCLDLYHSPELTAQVRKFVAHPNWVGDRPPGKRKRK